MQLGAVAVILHLVDPAIACRRRIHQRRQHRIDEGKRWLRRMLRKRFVPRLFMVEDVAQISAVDCLPTRRTGDEVDGLRPIGRRHREGVQLVPA